MLRQGPPIHPRLGMPASGAPDDDTAGSDEELAANDEDDTANDEEDDSTITEEDGGASDDDEDARDDDDRGNDEDARELLLAGREAALEDPTMLLDPPTLEEDVPWLDARLLPPPELEEDVLPPKGTSHSPWLPTAPLTQSSSVTQVARHWPDTQRVLVVQVRLPQVSAGGFALGVQDHARSTTTRTATPMRMPHSLRGLSWSIQTWHQHRLHKHTVPRRQLY